MAVSPEARSRPTYLDWNDALAAYFFMPGMAGRAVYLYVNEDVINEVGTPLGGGVPEFTAAVRQGPSWVNATKLGPEVDLHARHHRRSQGHEMILEVLG